MFVGMQRTCVHHAVQSLFCAEAETKAVPTVNAKLKTKNYEKPFHDLLPYLVTIIVAINRLGLL
jgi:hypothetical protein